MDANVAEQLADTSSLLHWYKELLNFRNSSAALQTGTLNLLPEKIAKIGLLGFTRELGSDRLTILINFSPQAIEFESTADQVLIQTGEVNLQKTKVDLGGYAGVILM
jgi:glycosidase